LYVAKLASDPVPGLEDSRMLVATGCKNVQSSSVVGKHFGIKAPQPHARKGPILDQLQALASEPFSSKCGIHKQSYLCALMHRLRVEHVKKSEGPSVRRREHEANLLCLPEVPMGLVEVALEHSPTVGSHAKPRVDVVGLPAHELVKILRFEGAKF
jgi:hypothetical protein